MRVLAALALALLPGVALAQSLPTPAMHGEAITVKPTGASVARTLAARFADTVNVVDRGADPTGVADSAPAFRAAMGSNRRVFVPPGTYRLASTVPPPCCAFDNAAVLVQGYSNFAIDGYGATLVVDPAIALSSALHFDKDTSFSVRGLTIQGTRSGLTSGQENVGLTVSSVVNFSIADIHLTGNFGGTGAGMAGDWMVDGTFDRIRMDAAGQCFDFAFLKHIALKGIIAYGADTAGTFGGGTKCMSFINDTPNAGTNGTGVSFTNTDGVSVRDSVATGFSTGAYITAGLDYIFTGNHWHDLAGAGAAKGIGVYIAYVNGGTFTSVGVPPSNIVISGDRFENNGAGVAGYGVLVDSSAIANSDAIANVAIENSVFANNASTGIGAVTTAGLSGLSLPGNLFSGASQTTAINSVAIAAGPTATSGAITAANGIGSNVPLAFVPKGTGALTAAIADSTATGGNPRGQNAIDWQTGRQSAAQVASGQASTIVGGSNNTASGIASFAGGTGSTAGNTGAVALGYGAQANGAYSAAFGNASNDHALTGSWVYASGDFAALGDAQISQRVLRAASSSTGSVRLTADGAAAGSANCLNIQDSTAYAVEIWITGLDKTTPANVVSIQFIRGVLSRASGAASTTWTGTSSGSVFNVGTPGTTSYSPTADTTNGCLNLSVTPPSSDSYHWVARVVAVEAQ